MTNPFNNVHFGARKPDWASVSSHNDVDVFLKQYNYYNATGIEQNSRGYVMASHAQSAEFATPQTYTSGSIIALDSDPTDTNKPLRPNRVYFPSVSAVMCNNSIVIRANLRGKVQDNNGPCNVLGKLPIAVNQGDVLTFAPEHRFRNNLGPAAKVSRIDITLTDRDNHIINFNGVPNEIAVVFEVYDIVDIPIFRHDEHSVKDPNAKTLSDGHYGEVYNFSQPKTLGGGGY